MSKDMLKCSDAVYSLAESKLNDEFYMGFAMYLASIAAKMGEVPVGAVVVHPKFGVVGVGINRREINKNALCHAEIEAIDAACRRLGGWRLFACDIYVTLEPCPMCAGAIVNSRIRRVVFGARDIKGGACISVMEMFNFKFNHQPLLTDGVLKDECSNQLSSFFKELRKKKPRRRKYIPPNA